MPPTNESSRFDLLGAGSFLVFVVLVAAWLLVLALPPPDGAWAVRLARACGYFAAAAMFIPYLHVLRRFYRYRLWGRMSTWLRWHIGAAYLGCALLLIHTWARAHG